MSNEIERKEIEAALAVLEKHGRKIFRKASQVSRGQAIGGAIYYQLGNEACCQLAMEVLEQWNAHTSVAAIAAIEMQQGTVKRDGRTLTITLPEWWK